MPNETPALKTPTPYKKVALISVCIGIVVIIIMFAWPYIDLARKNNITPGFLISLIRNNPQDLKKFDGRTNVLLLGISGENHDGATLSDSIILLSLDSQKKDAVILSIPRDIWSETLKDKINSAYAYGEAKQKKGGMLLAKSITEEIIGQPIHYALVIDFAGFKDLIDQIDGIDVNVGKGFTDKKYPIQGKENDECGGDTEFACRYKTIEFKQGLQHFDGEKALQYVRSRNADGEEGNDISRGKRQQDILLAVKDKILQKENLVDFKKLNNIVEEFESVIETDMTASELILFGRSFSDLKKENIKQPILSIKDPIEGKEGFLINPPVYEFNGLWVLIPREGNGNFDEIHQYIECWIVKKKCTINP